MSPGKGPFQKESSLPTIIIEGVCYFSGDYIWVFPKIGVPENGWFIVENPVKMDDLEVFGNTHIIFQTLNNALLQISGRYVTFPQKSHRIIPSISKTNISISNLSGFTWMSRDGS